MNILCSNGTQVSDSGPLWLSSLNTESPFWRLDKLEKISNKIMNIYNTVTMIKIA